VTLEYILNLDDLLAPITPERPQGHDIREDRSPTSSYYQIKDARNDGRSAERAAVLDTNVDTIGPWQTVINLAQQILSKQSKDLEVACWLIEALIRLYGFTGLRDGFVLLDKLVEQYWDNLYPEPDEDGLETKVISITGLNGESGEGTLLTPMRNALLCDPYSDTPFSFWVYQQALNADNIQDAKEKAKRTSELGYDLGSIKNAIMMGDNPFFTSLVATLEEALAAFKHLSETLRNRCGPAAPPSSNINNLLQEVIRTCRFIFKDKLIVAQEPITEVLSTQGGDSEFVKAMMGLPAVNATNSREGAISDREDALRRLADIADYFRRQEPHTPLGPSIERIVKWGRMTVAELMLELLPDQQAKGFYSQLTGVMLDGSDTKAYVPPAVISKPVAPAAAKAEGSPAAVEKTSGW
jgi:type VI secretion system protein ImpA